MTVVADMARSGRERHRRMVTQTMSTMMGDPLAQNVQVGKSTYNIYGVQ